MQNIGIYLYTTIFILISFDKIIIIITIILYFRKSLQKTEKELEKKISECSQLSQKLEILSITLNEKQHGSDEANDKIESVSRRLEAQMQELRKKEGPNNELKKQINGKEKYFFIEKNKFITMI